MSRLADKTMVVGVGAQKAGTTWLYEYLQRHPQVCMSPVKEMHVFDYRHVYSPDRFRGTLMKRAASLADLVAKRGGKAEKAYQRLLAAARHAYMIDYPSAYIDYFASIVDTQPVFGEITPAYSLLPAAGFREIQSLHPNVKFILVLRDPLRRAWSHVNYQLNRKGRDAGTEEKLSLMFDKRESRNQFFLKSDYRRTVETIDSVVSPENILYLFFEELFGERSLRSICDFLEVQYVPGEARDRVNEGSYSRDEIDVHQYAEPDNLYAPIYRFCRQRFGRVPGQWWSG